MAFFRIYIAVTFAVVSFLASVANAGIIQINLTAHCSSENTYFGQYQQNDTISLFMEYDTDALVPFQGDDARQVSEPYWWNDLKDGLFTNSSLTTSRNGEIVESLAHNVLCATQSIFFEAMSENPVTAEGAQTRQQAVLEMTSPSLSSGWQTKIELVLGKFQDSYIDTPFYPNPIADLAYYPAYDFYIFKTHRNASGTQDIGEQYSFTIDTYNTTILPEPVSIALMGLGGLLLTRCHRRGM